MMEWDSCLCRPVLGETQLLRQRSRLGRLEAVFIHFNHEVGGFDYGTSIQNILQRQGFTEELVMKEIV